MIRDYQVCIQKYNEINNKDITEKVIKKLIQKLKDKIDLSNVRMTFAPLYPDGSLGEIDWIYNCFELEDFNNIEEFKPIKIPVIIDENIELPPIKIGDKVLIEFIEIPLDIFMEVLKEVIKEEKKLS